MQLISIDTQSARPNYSDQDVFEPGKRCLSNSQTVMAGVTFKNQAFLQASRLRQEVLPIMRPDKNKFDS